MTDGGAEAAVLVHLDHASVRAGGSTLLEDVTWTVRAGEHWALLGPNGAGKSTLLALAGAARHPSAGSVHVLGSQVGRVDLRDLRSRLGVVDPAQRMPGRLTARQVVLTGLTGTVVLLPRRLPPDADDRVADALAVTGLAPLADRTVETLSQGERGRVRVARALVGGARLLLLDEPTSGLDLPGREDLLESLEGLASSRPDLATVLVTHAVEDVPRTTTGAVLLRDGRVLAAGRLADVLAPGPLSRCFGRAVDVARHDGRWSAWGARRG